MNEKKKRHLPETDRENDRKDRKNVNDIRVDRQMLNWLIQ